MDMPIQYYESLLYNCTRTYVDTLSGQPITLSCLSDIHQIYSLKQSEHYLTSDELLQLNDTLETLLEEKPTVVEEYKLVRSLTELLSGLIVHLGLYSRTNYHYRQQPRVMHVRTLDLGALNSRLQSMDTLWLATVAEKPPMNAFISETTKQLAAVLVSATESVFRFALRLNAKDFRTQPRIDTYLVTKVPKLRQILHVDPQYFSSPPPYQELSLSTSCMSRCFRSKSQRNLDSLRELVSDQDFAFRAFEEAVLANFVV